MFTLCGFVNTPPGIGASAGRSSGSRTGTAAAWSPRRRRWTSAGLEAHGGVAGRWLWAPCPAQSAWDFVTLCRRFEPIGIVGQGTCGRIAGGAAAAEGGRPRGPDRLVRPNRFSDIVLSKFKQVGDRGKLLDTRANWPVHLTIAIRVWRSVVAGPAEPAGALGIEVSDPPCQLRWRLWLRQPGRSRDGYRSRGMRRT